VAGGEVAIPGNNLFHLSADTRRCGSGATFTGADFVAGEIGQPIKVYFAPECATPKPYREWQGPTWDQPRAGPERRTPFKIRGLIDKQ